MKNLKIILSKEENFLGSAIKIKDDTILNTEILYIEDIIKNKKYSFKNDIIYFLCNGPLIYKILKRIENSECYIYNKDYLINNYTKLEVQQKIGKSINIPRILIFENLYKEKLPVFCKENKHTGIIFQAYSFSTINSFFSKFNHKDFYFEENVIDGTSDSKEYKLYYVFGNIQYKNDFKNHNKDIEKLCNKISKKLKLDVFSADFIETKNKCYLIDINPAAGFYLSDDARNHLVKHMEEGIK